MVGVLLENIVEKLVIVQIFRNGNLQLADSAALAEVGQSQQKHSGREDDEENCGQHYIAHAAGKADGNGEEDAGYITGGTGGGAETHQREGAGYGQTCAHVAVQRNPAPR